MRRFNICKGILAATLTVVAFQGANAQDENVDYYAPENVASGLPMSVICKKASLVRNIDQLEAKMELDLSGLKVKSNQAAVFQPMVVNGEDTLKLPGIAVYGRTRWYQYERQAFRPITGEGELAIRADQRRNELVKYSQTVEYDSWMNGSELILERTDYGCAGCEDLTVYEPEQIASYMMEIYEPEFVFQEAVAEVEKTRELTGRAYIDFPVNLITIFPDYRRNSVELAKIIATIDSVRNDKDITVKSLSIKGFASPEGPYDNNVRLAKGRTEALKNYVQQLYSFPYGFIQTSYEPEDWEGLREYVINSTLPSRYQIMQIIDSNLAPDPKNTKIQTDFPSEYEFLLQTVYPGLRHSDYKIEYVIRGFNDVAEIAEIMRTNPAKLSLNEMYRLAETYQPGSREYNDIMETAVMVYPTDEKALMNAATAAMQRQDYNQAERYLVKAGATADALYLRGVLAGLQRDYSKALWYFEQSQARGNEKAAAEILKIQQAKRFAK